MNQSETEIQSLRGALAVCALSGLLLLACNESQQTAPGAGELRDQPDAPSPAAGMSGSPGDGMATGDGDGGPIVAPGPSGPVGGGDGDQGAGDGDQGDPLPACTPSECGPALGLPSRMCPDGSVAGPGPCTRLPSGRCGYPIIDCPDGDDPGDGDGDGNGDGDGAPSGSGMTCGGIAALMCPAGEFCNYEADAGGLGCDGAVADTAGSCQPLPQACDDIAKPVCGCDRRTYSNACEAHVASTSVLREDACTDLDCEAIGGRVALGAGPPPMCNAGELDFGWLRFSSGAIPIEGAKCCVPDK